MNVIVYFRGPIDFWDGWMTEQQYRESLTREYASALQLFGPEQLDGRDAEEWRRYESFKRKALKIARERFNWEGDMREGPFIAGLPTAEEGEDGNVMLAWKQDNNGMTFIASPFALPWLA